MSTLFAFLHHVAAFTLVSALAVEFVLIRQDLTLAIARRLPIVDAVLGISAGFLLVVGLLRVFFFEKGRGVLLPQPCVHDEILGLYRRWTLVHYSDTGIPLVAQAGEAGGNTSRERAKIAVHSQRHPRRIGRGCHHSALRRDDGARRVDMTFTASGWHREPGLCVHCRCCRNRRGDRT
jgi:hypothetical protein